MFFYVEGTSDGAVKYMRCTTRFDSRGRHQSILPVPFWMYLLGLQRILKLVILNVKILKERVSDCSA